jgi:hypothetical protein
VTSTQPSEDVQGPSFLRPGELPALKPLGKVTPSRRGAAASMSAVPSDAAIVAELRELYNGLLLLQERGEDAAAATVSALMERVEGCEHDATPQHQPATGHAHPHARPHAARLSPPLVPARSAHFSDDSFTAIPLPTDATTVVPLAAIVPVGAALPTAALDPVADLVRTLLASTEEAPVPPDAPLATCSGAVTSPAPAPARAARVVKPQAERADSLFGDEDIRPSLPPGAFLVVPLLRSLSTVYATATAQLSTATPRSISPPQPRAHATPPSPHRHFPSECQRPITAPAVLPAAAAAVCETAAAQRAARSWACPALSTWGFPGMVCPAPPRPAKQPLQPPSGRGPRFDPAALTAVEWSAFGPFAVGDGPPVPPRQPPQPGFTRRVFNRVTAGPYALLERVGPPCPMLLARALAHSMRHPDPSDLAFFC